MGEKRTISKAEEFQILYVNFLPLSPSHWWWVTESDFFPNNSVWKWRRGMTLHQATWKRLPVLQDDCYHHMLVAWTFEMMDEKCYFICVAFLSITLVSSLKRYPWNKGSFAKHLSNAPEKMSRPLKWGNSEKDSQVEPKYVWQLKTIWYLEQQ